MIFAREANMLDRARVSVACEGCMANKIQESRFRVDAESPAYGHVVLVVARKGLVSDGVGYVVLPNNLKEPACVC